MNHPPRRHRQLCLFKGTYIEQIQQWMHGELGAGAWNEYFAGQGEPWAFRVMPSGWYQAEVVDRVLRQACADRGLDYSQTVANLAASTSRKDLPTVYRVFFRVMSPSAVFRFMPQLWRAYCSHGEMRVIRNETGHCVVDTVGIPEWLCEFTRGSVRGFMAQVVTLAGGSGPRAQITDEWEEKVGEFAGLRTLRGDIVYQD